MSEERGAGNPHATFCGSRRWATASGDPVGEAVRPIPIPVRLQGLGWVSLTQGYTKIGEDDDGPRRMRQTGCRVSPGAAGTGTAGRGAAVHSPGDHRRPVSGRPAPGATPCTLRRVRPRLRQPPDRGRRVGTRLWFHGLVLRRLGE